MKAMAPNRTFGIKALRVFCPLKKKWFKLIAEGKKTWEFRSATSLVGKQYIARSGSRFLVELRLGYSGPSVWKIVTEVRVFSSVKKIPKKILCQGQVSPRELLNLGIKGRVVGVHFMDTKWGDEHQQTCVFV
jgi:hypothetical protein